MVSFVINSATMATHVSEGKFQPISRWSIMIYSLLMDGQSHALPSLTTTLGRTKTYPSGHMGEDPKWPLDPPSMLHCQFYVHILNTRFSLGLAFTSISLMQEMVKQTFPLLVYPRLLSLLSLPLDAFLLCRRQPPG